MTYKLIKEIFGCWSGLHYSKKYIFYVTQERIARCIDKRTFELVWEHENAIDCFINEEVLLVELQDAPRILIYSLLEKRVLEIVSGVLNYTNSYNARYLYSSCFREGRQAYWEIMKYDLKANQVLKYKMSEYTTDLLLDDTHYLSINYDYMKATNGVVSKIDFDSDTVDWEYHISDLGPYMDWDYLNPPVWKERKWYNMYYMDGMVFLSVSKGVVALDAETGKQLWWVDFNTTETSTLRFDVKPNHLSFADGKICIRDWRQFVSIDMKTGEILMRKKYIDFRVGNEIVRGTLDDGVKIHNGKGYFVLDVQAELYLTSLDLETGEVKIETELPDVKDQVRAENIHFEGNRMYLQDNASFLYVYEMGELKLPSLHPHMFHQNLDADGDEDDSSCQFGI